MKVSTLKKLTLNVIAASVLTGCATSAPPSGPPGQLKVMYSQHYPDGRYLKELPTEVRLVGREATSKNVAQQVGLNVLLLAVGAFAVQGFSKDDLNGLPVSGPTDRGHLQNPIPTDFVARLQSRVNEAIQSHELWRTRTFAHPLVVGGGSTRLVYENLLGQEVETFRLKTDLIIYKKVEGASIMGLTGPTVVSCAGASPEAQPESRWAEDNYLPVRRELDALLLTCENTVIASLGELLGH